MDFELLPSRFGGGPVAAAGVMSSGGRRSRMASKQDRKKARQYMGRSLPRTILAIGRDWGAIIGLTCLGVWLDNWWFYVPIAWAIGAFQFAISESLLHEASHFNLAKNHRLNDALEIFYGSAVFADGAAVSRRAPDPPHEIRQAGGSPGGGLRVVGIPQARTQHVLADHREADPRLGGLFLCDMAFPEAVEGGTETDRLLGGDRSPRSGTSGRSKSLLSTG